MSVFIYIAMFGWVPLVLLLFAQFPARQVVLTSFIAAWMVLPQVKFVLFGIPDYDKFTAASYAVLLGTLLFDPRRFLNLRPRLFDLPIALYLLSPALASATSGLTAYDGLSLTLAQFLIWGLPYLIGRAYFETLADLKYMATGVFVAGLCYVVPCLVEIRMSPQIERWIYGIARFENLRYGGYRPKVLMGTGLELSLWMTATSVVGYILWASGAMRRLGGHAPTPFLAALVATTVLCKSTGALVLLVAGVGAFWVVKRTRYALPIWCLLLINPAYEISRTAGLWSGREVVEFTSTIVNPERAESFQFRLQNEEMLIARALEQPLFGWGGWNREKVADENGKHISIVDGRWILELGVHGIYGLATWNLMLTMPALLLLRRYRGRRLADPDVAPATALVLIVLLFVIDCLSNAMINPIYGLAMGATTTALGARRSRSGADDRAEAASGGGGPWDEALARVERAVALGAAGRRDEAGREHRHALGMLEAVAAQGPDDPGRRWALAVGYEAFARDLADSGREGDAAAVGARALEILDDLGGAGPTPEESRRRAAALRNDLAWRLTLDPGTAGDDAAAAVRLAEAAVAADPGRDAYRNTLAAALYRSGAYRAAIEALGPGRRAATAHDAFLLAMAYQRLGDPDRARAWLGRGADASRGARTHGGDLGRLRDEAVALLDGRGERRALVAPPAGRDG